MEESFDRDGACLVQSEDVEKMAQEFRSDITDRIQSSSISKISRRVEVGDPANKNLIEKIKNSLEEANSQQTN